MTSLPSLERSYGLGPAGQLELGILNDMLAG